MRRLIATTPPASRRPMDAAIDANAIRRATGEILRADS
jgi:hypothetical protein